MTKQRPLTDEICEVIATGNQWSGDIGDVIFRHEDMRAAADWQLGEVLNWLKSELGRGCYLSPLGYDGHEVDVDYVLEDLKEAMRPQDQQQQENNEAPVVAVKDESPLSDAQLFQRFVELSHALRATGSVVQNDHDRCIADGLINPSDVLASKYEFTARMTTLISDLQELQAATEKRIEHVHKQYVESES